MIRGKNDRIVITRDEVSGQPRVEVNGLWSGKDRHRIGRMLLKAMRTASYKERQTRKQADQKDIIEKKRLEGLKKYWAAKKEKKLKEEEKKNVRGQQEQNQ